MNLSILLTDFIDTKGMLKTYRFIPINQYNRIAVSYTHLTLPTT